MPGAKREYRVPVNWYLVVVLCAIFLIICYLWVNGATDQSGNHQHDLFSFVVTVLGAAAAFCLFFYYQFVTEDRSVKAGQVQKERHDALLKQMELAHKERLEEQKNSHSAILEQMIRAHQEKLDHRQKHHEEQLQTERVKRSLAFITEWNDELFAERRRRAIPHIKKLAALKSADERKNYAQTTDEMRAVLDVLNFFETVSIAIKKEVADEPTLKMFFRGMLLEYWGDLETFISEMRTRTKNFNIFAETNWLFDQWKDYNRTP